MEDNVGYDYSFDSAIFLFTEKAIAQLPAVRLFLSYWQSSNNLTFKASSAGRNSRLNFDERGDEPNLMDCSLYPFFERETMSVLRKARIKKVLFIGENPELELETALRIARPLGFEPAFLIDERLALGISSKEDNLRFESFGTKLTMEALLLKFEGANSANAGALTQQIRKRFEEIL